MSNWLSKETLALLEKYCDSAKRIKRKDIMSVCRGAGLMDKVTWRHFCRPEMMVPGMRGVYDLSKYNFSVAEAGTKKKRLANSSLYKFGKLPKVKKSVEETPVVVVEHKKTVSGFEELIKEIDAEHPEIAEKAMAIVNDEIANDYEEILEDELEEYTDVV